MKRLVSREPNKRGYNKEDAAFSKTAFSMVWNTGGLQKTGFVSFKNVEGSEEDLKAGTDYHFFKADGTKVRVGFRAQRGASWRTFTIRSGHKRDNASASYEASELDHLRDGTGPALLLHCYIFNTRVEFALATAKGLLEAIQAGGSVQRHSNVTFTYIHWAVLAHCIPNSLLLSYPKQYLKGA